MVPWISEYGQWEPEESALVRSWLKPGMTMIDVGAHVGYYTILAAQCVARSGRVLAIEPDPDNYELLLHNVSSRGLRNVGVLHAAALDTTGPVTLRRSGDNSGDHRVQSISNDTEPAVSGFALDDLLPDSFPLHVVKVDTQGADHRVVEGLVRTLRRCRPRLVVEFWPPGIVDVDPADLPDYYRGLGYSIGALETGPLGPSDSGIAFVEAAAASQHGFLTLILNPL